MKRFLKNYAERHLNWINRALHIIGVPVTFIGTPILAVMGYPWWAVACFAGGYALQFVGHAIEGNDAGEAVLIKKLLHKPYREFGPLHQDDPTAAEESDQRKFAG